MHTNEELRQKYVEIISGNGALPFNPERDPIDGTFVDLDIERGFYWFQRGFKVATKEIVGELQDFVAEFEYPA